MRCVMCMLAVVLPVTLLTKVSGDELKIQAAESRTFFQAALSSPVLSAMSPYARAPDKGNALPNENYHPIVEAVDRGLRSRVKSTYVPTIEFIEEHLVLIPARHTTTNEDTAHLSYRIANKSYRFVIVSGNVVRLSLFIHDPTRDKVQSSEHAATLIEGFLKTYIENDLRAEFPEVSVRAVDIEDNKRIYIAKADSPAEKPGEPSYALQCYFNNEEACLIVQKIPGTAPARDFKSNEWFTAGKGRRDLQAKPMDDDVPEVPNPFPEQMHDPQQSHLEGLFDLSPNNTPIPPEEPMKFMELAPGVPPAEEAPTNRPDWRKTPRDPFWAGVGLDAYWPDVGIEYPVRPSDREKPYPLDYSRLYEYVVVPTQAIPARDQHFGSRFSWLRESAYDKLDKLQDEEMNARFYLESPWKKWKEAILKQPKAVQKVVSVRHNRIFTTAYGDAVYDYPLDAVDGWELRFVASVRSRRNPVQIEFLQRKDIAEAEIAAIGQQLGKAERLRDVKPFANLLAELPLVDFGGANWELNASQVHHDPTWMEVSFTGPLGGRINNNLEFVYGSKGILVRLEGFGLRRLGTDLAPASISDGPRPRRSNPASGDVFQEPPADAPKLPSVPPIAAGQGVHALRRTNGQRSGPRLRPLREKIDVDRH